MELLTDYMDKLRGIDQTVLPLFAALTLLGSAVVVYGVYTTVRKVTGNIIMKRKQRQRERIKSVTKEIMDESFREVVEDRLVCQLSRRVEEGLTSPDDARIIYANFARLGFWGLTPRKLNLQPSPLSMALLKERLIIKWRPERVRVNNGQSTVGAVLLEKRTADLLHGL